MQRLNPSGPVRCGSESLQYQNVRASFVLAAPPSNVEANGNSSHSYPPGGRIKLRGQAAFRLASLIVTELVRVRYLPEPIFPGSPEFIASDIWIAVVYIGPPFSGVLPSKSTVPVIPPNTHPGAFRLPMGSVSQSHSTPRVCRETVLFTKTNGMFTAPVISNFNEVPAVRRALTPGELTLIVADEVYTLEPDFVVELLTTEHPVHLSVMSLMLVTLPRVPWRTPTFASDAVVTVNVRGSSWTAW